MARPKVPHCRECECYGYQRLMYSLSVRGFHYCFYDIMIKGLVINMRYGVNGKCMTQKESRTSPKWCPKRIERQK